MNNDLIQRKKKRMLPTHPMNMYMYYKFFIRERNQETVCIHSMRPYVLFTVCIFE